MAPPERREIGQKRQARKKGRTEANAEVAENHSRGETLRLGRVRRLLRFLCFLWPSLREHLRSDNLIMAAPAPRAPLPSCTLEIKAVPNAPRNAVVGWLGDALKVKVHAPALEGRANEELCEFLADELDLPRRAVTLLRGDKSRQKVVRLEGLDLAETKRRLKVL